MRRNTRLRLGVLYLRRGVVILSIGIAGLLCSFFVPAVAADGVRAGDEEADVTLTADADVFQEILSYVSPARLNLAHLPF